MSDFYDGRAIANFVLDFCDSRGTPITNLSLQKIVYFCHAWSLVTRKEPLIRHKFEAWEFGPVLPYLYREFKTFERSPVKGRATQIDPQTGRKQVVPYAFSDELRTHLTETVAFYSRLRAGDLVEMSHADGGPWHKAWYHGGRSNPGMQINNDNIAEFYSKVRCPFSIQ